MFHNIIVRKDTWLIEDAVAVAFVVANAVVQVYAVLAFFPLHMLGM